VCPVAAWHFQRPAGEIEAALQVPVSELFIGQSLAQFKKEVEERTAISIEIFDDGKPYNDAQIVGAVTSGAMQLGVAGFNQFADKIPAVDIIEQPFLFNFDALINAAFAPAGEIRGMIEKALLDTMGGCAFCGGNRLAIRCFFPRGGMSRDRSRLKVGRFACSATRWRSS
jgi:TRAP-type C4-dicarboxylate transport system substrate-binding protein